METKKEEAIDFEKQSNKEPIKQESKSDNQKDDKKTCCNKKDFNLGFSFGLLVTSIIAALLIFFVHVYLIHQKQWKTTLLHNHSNL